MRGLTLGVNNYLTHRHGRKGKNLLTHKWAGGTALSPELSFTFTLYCCLVGQMDFWEDRRT